jgi:hypothetical protein
MGGLHTDGSAPNKGNGTPVAAAFSKYAEPNRTWYVTIPAQAVGATVNYVFYSAIATWQARGAHFRRYRRPQ